MCIVCNPMCGRCKPPLLKAVVCPECRKLLTFKKEEALSDQQHICPWCGYEVTSLVKIAPVKCQTSGKWCAYPCGNSHKSNGPEYIDCTDNTPPNLAS